MRPRFANVTCHIRHFSSPSQSVPYSQTVQKPLPSVREDSKMAWDEQDWGLLFTGKVVVVIISLTQSPHRGNIFNFEYHHNVVELHGLGQKFAAICAFLSYWHRFRPPAAGHGRNGDRCTHFRLCRRLMRRWWAKFWVRKVEAVAWLAPRQRERSARSTTPGWWSDLRDGSATVSA